MATYEIELDTCKQSIVPKQVRGRVGDAESCVIEATITENGAAYPFSGRSVRFECEKPDGGMVRDPSATVSGSKVTYRVPVEVLGAEGVIKCAYFRIYQGTAYVDSTESFIIDVKRGVGGDLPGSYLPEVDAVLAACKQQNSDMAEAELERAAAEAKRAAAEAARASEEASRAAAEAQRLLDEAQRVAAEESRVDAEDGRVAAEAERADAEKERAKAENGRTEAEQSRALAEAARVTEFEQIRQNAQSIRTVLLSEGQYDPDTMAPVIEGEQGVTYYVPSANPSSGNRYTEWSYLLLSDGSEQWEVTGSSDSIPDAITTADVDAVIAGESPTGSRFMALSTLKYWWAQIKTRFAPMAHTHSGADIHDNSITSAKVVNGTLVNEDLSVNAAIAGSKLADASISRAKLDASLSQDIADLEDAWESVGQRMRGGYLYLKILTSTKMRFDWLSSEHPLALVATDTNYNSNAMVLVSKTSVANIVQGLSIELDKDGFTVTAPQWSMLIILSSVPINIP